MSSNSNDKGNGSSKNGDEGGSHCTSYDLTEFGFPLEARTKEIPNPNGTEVLLRVRRAGVCHSDLHLSEGFFDLGSEGSLSVRSLGIRLPLTMGHEIVGEVVAFGPEVTNLKIGQTVLVFPWVGCGKCDACVEGRENDCAKMRPIGFARDGGYSTHLLVEHPRLLVDLHGISIDAAATYACSGLTVFSAFKKLKAVKKSEWIAVFGAGGLGLNAVSIASALGYDRIVAIDINPRKLDSALSMGASAVVDGSQSGAPLELRKITKNQLAAAIDTVANEATSKFAINALRKAGSYVAIGLHGGELKLPIPLLTQKALSLYGCYVGSLKDLHELLDLVRLGKVKQIPINLSPMSKVNSAMRELKNGDTIGRTVLIPD